jgi:hypothetical protein
MKVDFCVKNLNFCRKWTGQSLQEGLPPKNNNILKAVCQEEIYDFCIVFSINFYMKCQIFISGYFVRFGQNYAHFCA